MAATAKESICIGLDIGGTNTACGFVNAKGDMLLHFECPTNHNDCPEDFVKRISDRIQMHLQTIGDSFVVKAMGIAAPNGNCYTGEIVAAPNLNWSGKIPLAQLFETALNCPVFLNNDANAAAWGEKVYGLAKDCEDFILISLGTGLGCGIVSGGQLLRGHEGFAGEFGHSIFIPNGRDCACGRKGCLEQYASATALCITYRELCEGVKQNTLLTRSEKELSAQLIHEAALKGDLLAQKAFQQTAAHLGLALANMVALSNPEKIILFGGLSKAGEILSKPLQEAMELNLWHIYKGKITITLSGLKESSAAILGAAVLAREEISEI